MARTRATTDEHEVAVAVRNLGLAMERWRGAFARRHRLADNDSVVLSMLAAAGGGLRPRDLSGPMGVSTGTLTAMLDRLEGRRFVTRSPNPDDRRSTIVSLTRTGRTALADTLQAFEHGVDAAVPAAQRPALVRHVQAMTATVDELAQQVEHGRRRTSRTGSTRRAD